MSQRDEEKKLLFGVRYARAGGVAQPATVEDLKQALLEAAIKAANARFAGRAPEQRLQEAGAEVKKIDLGGVASFLSKPEARSDYWWAPRAALICKCPICIGVSTPSYE